MLLSCFYTAAAEQAKDELEIETELRSLEQDITRYKDILGNTEDQKSAIEETLKRNEKDISKFIKQIESIERDLTQQRKKILSLANRQLELNRLKTEQQKHIEQQARAAYEIGKEKFFKLLLNLEDPIEINRLKTYYDYFIFARAEHIRKYNDTMTELDNVSSRLAEEIQSLEINHQTLNRDRSALAASQRQKHQTLQTLKTQIHSTGNEINKLEKNRAYLEKLLNHIQIGLAGLATSDGVPPFKDMRGRMFLPTNGEITETFGKRRSTSKLKWKGLFIKADQGQPVYAVHYGRVIFSDWLRGFGLLIIISHGDGYMSLYGHNEVLYLKAGDWVGADDLIATVGNSGGQTQTGLYFEIRINGKPSDPKKWCTERAQRAA